MQNLCRVSLAAAAHCQTDSTLSKSTTSPFLLITKDVGEEPALTHVEFPFLGTLEKTDNKARLERPL
jgi:hypothetical protein